jgi:hypothetical protein
MSYKSTQPLKIRLSIHLEQGYQPLDDFELVKRSQALHFTNAWIGAWLLRIRQRPLSDHRLYLWL